MRGARAARSRRRSEALAPAPARREEAGLDPRPRQAALPCAAVAAAGGMTAEEMKADGAPLEGVDITPKRDEGVLKVPGGCGRPLPVPISRTVSETGGEGGSRSLLACERALPGSPAPPGPALSPEGTGSRSPGSSALAAARGEGGRPPQPRTRCPPAAGAPTRPAGPRSRLPAPRPGRAGAWATRPGALE